MVHTPGRTMLANPPDLCDFVSFFGGWVSFLVSTVLHKKSYLNMLY